jgi:hypothetical protein
MTPDTKKVLDLSQRLGDSCLSSPEQGFSVPNGDAGGKWQAHSCLNSMMGSPHQARIREYLRDDLNATGTAQHSTCLLMDIYIKN